MFLQVHVHAKDLQTRRGLRAPGARLQALHEGGGLGAVTAPLHVSEQGDDSIFFENIK